MDRVAELSSELDAEISARKRKLELALEQVEKSMEDCYRMAMIGARMGGRIPAGWLEIADAHQVERDAILKALEDL